MKKSIAMIILGCLILVGIVYVFNFVQKSEQEDVHTLFERWDRGEIGQSEKTRIINILANDLKENTQIDIEEIEAISDFISVFEVGSIRIIEYIENPKFYGISGRESFHLVVYHDLVEIIDNQGSMRIEEVEKRDEHLYYFYATDYRFSNITGIRTFKIEIEDEHAIHRDSLINKEMLTDNFRYDEKSEVLYYDDGHIYYKEIRDNGSEVLITVGDTDYLLELGEDELYHVSPIR